MKVQVVTTFSEDGYKVYGKRFLESFLAHDHDTDLIAYHEHKRPELVHPRLYWRSLEDDQDRSQFLAMHGDDPEKVGTPADPNSQSIRFCHKVFAVTHAVATAAVKGVDWLVWMDADVIVHKKPKWPVLLPPSADLAYLGRKNIQIKPGVPFYTECGFVAYRVTSEAVQAMAEDMRRYYMSGEMFKRPKSDWHDSRCFDICRLRSKVPMDRWNDLSSHIQATHVWPHVPSLASWSTHNKGPGRKRGAYGAITA